MRFQFEDFTLDSERRELRRGVDLIPIEPQVFDLLEYLINNRNRVVSRDDIFEAIWQGRIVSDSALTSRINAVRSAIGDDGGTQRLVRTSRGKGFRFVGSVREASDPASTPSTTEAMVEDLPLPDRPSIAILPFVNMIGDIEQDYISDGITEDIITALSQIREFFVIARSTMFTYKGRPIDVQALSTQLGVRYVLEGSVRTAGQRLRISVQLNDGTIGSQIWAERFDRDLEDIFAVQDEIAQIVVGVLGRELSHAEQRRAVTKPPGNLDAWGLFHRGMFHFYRRTREDNIEARRLFELAIDRDPSFATPYAMISRTRSVDAILFGRDRDSGLAFTTARRAIELDDRAASSHFALGLAHLFIERDGAAAFLAFTEAITINPNDAQGNTGIAMALIGLGRAEEAIAYLERAIRLSPWDSNIGTFFGRLAIGNLFLERHEAAVEWGRKAEPRTKVWIERIALPAALALLGRAVEAQKACEELKALRPKLSLEIVRSNEPTAHQRYLDILLDGLRKAGLEER